jgi:hypothetical protein
VQTYLAITDNEIVYDHREISEVCFWTHDQIDQLLGQEIFTPNFEEEWQMFKTFARRYQSADPDRTAFCTGTSFPDLWQEMYAANCPDSG